MKILLELSPTGVRIDHVATVELREQMVAARVITHREPDLKNFGDIVKAAYREAHAQERVRQTKPKKTPGTLVVLPVAARI